MILIRANLEYVRPLADGRKALPIMIRNIRGMILAARDRGDRVRAGRPHKFARWSWRPPKPYAQIRGRLAGLRSSVWARRSKPRAAAHRAQSTVH
jgi:hypothetical protein